MGVRTGRGCARGLGCVLLLILLGAGLWLARDPVGEWMGRLELGIGAEPSERLARAAEEKLDRLAREGLAEELRLSEAELQSLLTYRSGPTLPPGVEEPRIDVQDSIVVLSARLRPDEIEGFPTPDAIRSALSDTSRVTAGLVPELGSPGQALLRVRSLQVGSIVIPPLMLPAFVAGLEAQGVRTSNGALVVPMPRSVADVRIEGDDLVLAPAPSGTGPDSAGEETSP